MNEKLLRIRKIFSDSGMSQTAIGKKINKTSQYVWKLLNDDTSNPSESVIADICRQFDVNDEWIKNGNGEPYKKRNRNQEIGYFANELMSEADESFKKRFIYALSKLDERDWETIAKIIEKMK